LLLQEETLRRRAKEQEARLLKLREEEEVRLEEKRVQLMRAEQQAREEAIRVQEELRKERAVQARLKEQLEREERQRVEVEERAHKQKIEEEHRAQLRRLEEERMTEAQKRLLEEERLDLQKERQLIETMRREKELKLRRKQEAKEQKEREERLAREEAERIAEELRQLELKEEEERRKAEQERLQKEEEEQRRIELETLRLQEEEQRLAAEKEEAERMEEELRRRIAYEQIAASAVFIPPKAAVPVENTISVTADVAGDVVTCAWDLPEGNATATNWLGLYPVHQPFNTKKYVQFAYTNGSSTGEHVFRGVTPGHYEARFFATRGYEHVARSATVRVGPAATLVTQLQGEHLLVYYTLDPESATPTKEWLGVYEKTQRRNKLYLSTAYGNAEGRVMMKAPRNPGTYELRLFVSGAVYNDQARVEFVVEDNDCIKVEQQAVAAGGNVNVNWVLHTLEPSSGDWIGLYRADEANNSNYLSCTYTQGVSVGTVSIPAPTKEGVYEFRLFSRAKGKYVTFRTSQPLAVTAPLS